MSPFYREKKSQFYYRQSLQLASNLFNVIDPLFRETAFVLDSSLALSERFKNKFKIF